MVTELKIPKIGVEMQSAVIDEWAINDGSQVTKGDVVLSIQTEKVTYEVESPDSGYIKIIGKEGDEYEVGAVVAIIAETQDELSTLQDKVVPQGEVVPQEEIQADVTKDPGVSETVTNSPVTTRTGKVRATPLAKKIAKENGIDLAAISGSGPRGAIVKRDVLKAIEIAKASKKEQTAAVPDRKEEIAAVDSHSANEKEAFKQASFRKPLKGMRKTIAAHMRSSLQTSAQLTDINEINVSKLVEFRNELNKEIAEHLGFKISFNHLFIKAISIILKELPVFNSSITGEEIIQWVNINIGFAASVEDGLVVPVIKNVDQLSLNEIAIQFSELAERAKNGSLTTDDISGGTFTVTNIGSYGGYISTPIINQPQVAILGLGQIQAKPIVTENREIGIGEMLGYGLTFDHRLIDGAVAGEFLKSFIHIMRNPKLLLVK